MRSSHIRITATCLALTLVGCGGGSGLGPGGVKKQEDKLKEELPTDWDAYNSGDFAGAIEVFEETLRQADASEAVESVKNQVKSEAHNGIGWAFIQGQDLESAAQAFAQATRLDRRNADAWVGWAGVSLALQNFADVVQFAATSLELDPEYNSGTRGDDDGRLLSHDGVDARHVRLMLAEAYFQLGRYTAAEWADPGNATAQLRLVRSGFRFQDPGQLLKTLSQVSIELQDAVDAGT